MIDCLETFGGYIEGQINDRENNNSNYHDSAVNNHESNEPLHKHGIFL